METKNNTHMNINTIIITNANIVINNNITNYNCNDTNKTIKNNILMDINTNMNMNIDIHMITKINTATSIWLCILILKQNTRHVVDLNPRCSLNTSVRRVQFKDKYCANTTCQYSYSY